MGVDGSWGATASRANRVLQRLLSVKGERGAYLQSWEILCVHT